MVPRRFRWLRGYDVNLILDAISARADQACKALAQPRLAIVTSSDFSTAMARVLLQPEGVLTGWLPILTLWSGAGWGLICPPSPGDQVLVIPREGDAEHGVIVGSLFSNAVRPPSAAVGEFVLHHQSGSSIRLSNDGTVRISGDLKVSGDVYDAHGSLARLRNDHNTHIHRVLPGSITSVPIVQD